ncbi:MAG: hypothetical protein ACT4O1_14960, partial [Gemmatimonadota bacterium]
THSNLDASAKAQFRSMIPRTKPAFETFINDDEGRLWVIGYKQGGSPPTRPVDVFEAYGRYLGRLNLDIAIYPPPRIIGDRVVAVTRDEMDVEHVVVYRIVMP